MGTFLHFFPYTSSPYLLLSNGNQRYLLRCKLWSSSNFSAHCMYFEQKGLFMNVESQSCICTYFFSIFNHHNMPKALKRSASLSSSLLFFTQRGRSIYNQQRHRNIQKKFVHFFSICTNIHALSFLPHTHVCTQTHTQSG